MTLDKALIGLLVVACILAWQVPQILVGIVLGALLVMLSAYIAGWIKED